MYAIERLREEGISKICLSSDIWSPKNDTW